MKIVEFENKTGEVINIICAQRSYRLAVGKTYSIEIPDELHEITISADLENEKQRMINKYGKTENDFTKSLFKYRRSIFLRIHFDCVFNRKQLSREKMTIIKKDYSLNGFNCVYSIFKAVSTSAPAVRFHSKENKQRMQARSIFDCIMLLLVTVLISLPVGFITYTAFSSDIKTTIIGCILILFFIVCYLFAVKNYYEFSKFEKYHEKIISDKSTEIEILKETDSYIHFTKDI